MLGYQILQERFAFSDIIFFVSPNCDSCDSNYNIVSFFYLLREYTLFLRKIV